MTIRRTLLVSSLLASLFALATVACTTETDSTSSTPTPTPGDTDAGTNCTGDAPVEITITGVPAGATAKVTLTGPSGSQTVEANGTVTLASGEYTVSAEDIVVADPIARTVHRAAEVPTLNVCGGADAGAATLEVAYAPIGSSGKIWMSNSNGSAYVLGFTTEAAAATASVPASVVAKTQGRHGIAFDGDGNLWALAATTEDPTLIRYPAASLAASGDKTPDRKIVVKEGGCLPGARDIAFDRDGNLWLASICDKKVKRLTPADLTSDGEKTPAVEIGGLTAPQAIAFDGDGNLWVADGAVRRYDASRLAASGDAPADLVINVAGAASEALAFDAAGALWSVGGSDVNLSHLPKAELSGTGTKDVTPDVAISVGVGALPGRPAFDESGGLWIATSAGKFARLAPAQLTVASTYASPTVPERVVTSTDIGSAGAVAIFPPPAALPLYPRIP